jgi:DNA repair exonuclease SbcCD ATPase subunit
MTGGERASIFVDSEFEILVDGQPINTLSGSGKAIANLAIRIALGQVLINKKFSIFMGDEIDGDMDAERATWTAECLSNLSKHISQLILISHKNIEADNYIRL